MFPSATCSWSTGTATGYPVCREPSSSTQPSVGRPVCSSGCCWSTRGRAGREPAQGCLKRGPEARTFRVPLAQRALAPIGGEKFSGLLDFVLRRVYGEQGGSIDLRNSALD